jgi:hypothetical protein
LAVACPLCFHFSQVNFVYSRVEFFLGGEGELLADVFQVFYASGFVDGCLCFLLDGAGYGSLGLTLASSLFLAGS